MSPLLAFFQGTQLSLFERFLTQAVSGINSTSITSGMQNVGLCRPAGRFSLAGLSIGDAWRRCAWTWNQSDQVCRHRDRGDELQRYLYHGQSGLCKCRELDQQCIRRGNVFENWLSDLQTQFNQDGFQKMWGLITGVHRGPDRRHPDSRCLHSLSVRRLRSLGSSTSSTAVVLYIFGPIVIASHAPRSNESPCQGLCRKRHDLECMADPLRRFRCSAERGSDGTGRSDAQPK